MSYVINSAAQGTPEWLAARAGRITGSMAHMARKVGMLTDQQAKYVAAIKAGADEKAAMLAAGYRAKPRAEAIEKALAGMLVGDWGEESKKYAFKLAVERISGECIESGFGGSFYTKRGHLAEAECRMVYELRMDCLITETGFMCTDDGKFGVSPDGLIDEDEGWECKGYTDPAKLMPVLLGNDFTGFRDQCLMGLWLTGRRRWTQALYLPALNCIGRDLSSFTIDRKDEGVEDEITQLETDLMALDALVESYRARLLAGCAPAEILGCEPEQVESDSTLVMACDVGDVARASVPASDPPLSDGEPMTAEHARLEAERLAEMTADAPKPQDDDPMDGHILTDKETVSCGDAANNGPSCGDGSHMADVTQPLSAAPACVDSPPTINAQGLAGDFLVESDSTPATLKLGDINIRLGFTMTADFVASTLGMPWRDTAKSAKLWRESDWPLIKAALVKHVEGLL